MAFIESFFSFSFANVALAIVLFLTIFIFQKYKSHGLPPGPWGIPFFGYLPFIGIWPEEKFDSLRKKYGNIFCFNMGNTLTVVLNDINSIQEALLNSDSFNDRPVVATTKLLPDDKGIISVNGELWRVQKRIILRALREHGLKKDKHESMIQNEIAHYLNVLTQFKNESFNPHRTILQSLSGIVHKFLCGKEIVEDENFLKICLGIYQFPKFAGTTDIRCILPWTRYIPIINYLTNQKKLASIKTNTTDYFKKLIDETNADNVKDDRSNYVNAFYTERNKNMEKFKSNEFLPETALLDNLFELMAAGMNTLVTSLYWTYLIFMVNPKIQKKLQSEIDRIIGRNRLPSLNDRSQMIYAEAVVMEVQRWSSFVPINVIHSNAVNATLSGYQIPKNSLVLCNLKAVHFDKDLWGDPEIFRPERFIVNGKIHKPEYLIPFSIGKRACVGEILAKTELFLYTTSVFQKFTIELPKNEPPPSLEPENHGIIRVPKDFKMIIKPRSEKDIP